MAMIVTLESIEDGFCKVRIKPEVGTAYYREFSKAGLDEYVVEVQNYCEYKGYEFVYQDKTAGKNRLYSKTSEGKEEKYYVLVESHYEEKSDGKDQEDAIVFEMGQYVGDEQPDKKWPFEIDSVVTVSTKEARLFAQAILKLCDEIES